MPKGLSRPLRIALLYPVPYLDSVPAVRNLIVMLAESGAQVDVFVLENGDRHNPVRFGSGTRVFALPPRPSKGLGSRIPNFLRFLAMAWRGLKGGRERPDFLIGVDPAGASAAYLLGKARGIPLIYYSLEIIASYDPKRMYRGYKTLERRASHAARHILIQDEGRARVLAEDNGVPLSKFVYLPNSQLEVEARPSTTRYFHEKFGLPPETRIALYAGSISAEFWSRELAAAAAQFPEDWVLVFHSRSRRTLAELEAFFGFKLNRDRIFISADPVEASDVAKIFASCDLGFAFYTDLDSPNIRFIGKSAGKVTSLLMQGKPVIMTSLPGWDKWLFEYSSGVAVRSSGEIPSALASIAQDFGRYQAGARRHFASELRFEPAFHELLSKIGDFSGKGRT